MIVITNKTLRGMWGLRTSYAYLRSAKLSLESAQLARRYRPALHRQALRHAKLATKLAMIQDAAIEHTRLCLFTWLYAATLCRSRQSLISVLLTAQKLPDTDKAVLVREQIADMVFEAQQYLKTGKRAIWMNNDLPSPTDDALIAQAQLAQQKVREIFNN